MITGTNVTLNQGQMVTCGDGKQWTIACAPGNEPGGGGGGDALFSDNFISGDLTHTQNGFVWTGGVFGQNSIIDDAGSSSGKALRIRYNEGGTYSGAEQRYYLGALYPEIWIKMTVLIPANYSQINNDIPVPQDNNKFLRLWHGNTGDGNNGYSNYYVKNGASIYPHASPLGSSELRPEMSNDGEGMDVHLGPIPSESNPPPTIIDSVSDAGQERTFVFQLKVDTTSGTSQGPASQGGNGIFAVWKDGVLQSRITTWLNKPSNDANNYFEYGYVFGATSAAYQNGTQEVDFLIREFSVAETNIFGVAE